MAAASGEKEKAEGRAEKKVGDETEQKWRERPERMGEKEVEVSRPLSDGGAENVARKEEEVEAGKQLVHARTVKDTRKLDEVYYL